MPDTQNLKPKAPSSDIITPYDREHFKLYLRLLDAEEEDVHWKVAAAEIMGLGSDGPSSKSCWQSHLQRAKWMSNSGYRQLLDSPE